MAKRNKTKLTHAAIAFIIEKRTDPLNSYTFDEIAEMLGKDKDFMIKITGQAVGRSYRKHKDDEAFKSTRDRNIITDTVQVINKDTENNVEIKSSKKPKNLSSSIAKSDKPKVFEPIDVKVDSGKDFDEDAHKEFNYQDFLIPKNEG